MERRRTLIRRRPYYRPSFMERAKKNCRLFTAFMFSNVGIILLVVLYTIAGAFMFQAIEGDQNSEKVIEIARLREKLVQKLWTFSCCEVNIFNKSLLFDLVQSEVLEYQHKIVKAVKLGWNGEAIKDKKPESQWNFSAGFLYSLTVITTIGYGNISPKTELGKIVTIFYAIIGMPLFLLYLSNIGDILAKSFKWIYAKICLCRVCPGVARKRALRERRKTHDLSIFDPSWSNYRIENPDIENNWDATIPYDGDAEFAIENNDSIVIADEIETVTVPITVCLSFMICYILLGALLFRKYEDITLLDGSYFCFISLSSIGFGDIVPGFKIAEDGAGELVNFGSAACAVYLLLGMALIAMCFNLMQEQVIHKMRVFKKVIKRCFRCDR